GQLRPTMGHLSVFGMDPWQNEGLLNRIGLCPAIQAHYPFISGVKWVAYLTQLRGFPRKQAHQMAVESMTVVGMEQAMNRAMSSYSLGMRQRTVLAQSIAHKPELLILDEPFNGLDPKGRYEMTLFLKSWVKEGRSVILASHILHEVETLNPSLLLVSGGRLLASGSPQQVRSILANCPNSIRVRCRQTAELAALVASNFEIASISIDSKKQELAIETMSPLELLKLLPGLAIKNNLLISELRSSDDSLQNIFSMLMLIHRGGMRLPE
ncbi:MAG: ABC transporter ATP-binding protein, partial [Pirellulaceae bacterium]|nr:ABC transporter ATP-binding protein [Pirellulaceae bacterium]